MAEEEEEDLFAGTETADSAQAPSQPASTAQKPSADGKLDPPQQSAELEDGEEEGEAIEEDSSDSVGLAHAGRAFHRTFQ